MKFKLRFLLPILASLLVCSCATTKLKSSWKSPDYQGGQLKKIAVLVVDDRALVRQVFEGHTAGSLNRRGQPAVQVRDYFSLPEIMESKGAAATKLREAGADSVLVIRLVDAPEKLEKRKPDSPNITMTGGSSEWFEYYIVAYSGNSMGVDLSSNTQHYYIEYTLYELSNEKRIWSCVTETNVKYNSDWLELIKPLTTVVLDNMAKDGLIR